MAECGRVPDSNPAMVQRPILIEECTRQQISESLETLIQELYQTGVEVTKLELIASLVYILMLETGFTPANIESNIQEQFTGDVSFNMSRMRMFCQHPRNWKSISKTCLEQHFYLKPCQEAFNVVVSLTTFGTGITLNLIVMNLITKELEHLFPYFISTVKYILNQNAPVERKFNNLRELSIDFKNKVAFPAKCTILNSDFKSHACLQYLPYELQLRIATFLELNDLGKFVRCCKHLNQVCEEPSVWKLICKRVNKERWKMECNKEKNGIVNWRNVCKDLVQHKAQIRRQQRSWEWSYTM